MERVDLTLPLASTLVGPIGYCPYQASVQSPGDRRRFPTVARKLGLEWQVFQEGTQYRTIYVTSNADLTRFSRWPQDGTKIVFEMVDSYLEAPTWHPKTMIRGVGKWALGHHRHLELSYSKTIEAMCRRADLVVCSTPEQRDRMSGWNGNIHCILDLHEELGAARTNGRPDTGTINIFWEGLGQTTAHFAEIARPLQALASERPIRLHLVTDLSYKALNVPGLAWDTKKRMRKLLAGVNFFLAEWNPTAIEALAATCDFAVLPINRSDRMARSKPENRLLIAWHLGLPAIVSDTPAHTRLMTDYGGPRWLCRGEGDWLSSLRDACDSATARERASQAGLAYATREHSTEVLLGKWQSALATISS